MGRPMNQSNGRGLRCVTERKTVAAAKPTLEQLGREQESEREREREGGSLTEDITLFFRVGRQGATSNEGNIVSCLSRSGGMVSRSSFLRSSGIRIPGNIKVSLLRSLPRAAPSKTVRRYVTRI